MVQNMVGYPTICICFHNDSHLYSSIFLDAKEHEDTTPNGTHGQRAAKGSKRNEATLLYQHLTRATYSTHFNPRPSARNHGQSERPLDTQTARTYTTKHEPIAAPSEPTNGLPTC